MKKKIITGVIVGFTLLLIIFGSYYFYSLTAVDKKDSKEIVFVVNSGTSKVDISKELKDADLIRNDKTALIYLVFNKDISIQAGTYSLSKDMSLKSIFDVFNTGKIKTDTVSLTLIEGKRLKEYVSLISKDFGYKEDEIIDTINSKDFLKRMVEKYWFLTDDVLNDKIYYGLEGYILPDTYEFMSNYSIEDIFIRLLDYTDTKLSAYKEAIEKSDYNVHEILSMASIIELEANSKDDREKVSQVIIKRLNSNMSLGMDVTTYYATQKDMGEELTYSELVAGNAYNTRNTNMLGLPVGPICNPSNMSIEAALNPSNTNYLYFYADIKTGLVYFANTSAEFNQIIKEVG